MGLISRNGRLVLVLGLLLGIAFPAAAKALEQYVALMVALLLLLNAFRNSASISANVRSNIQNVFPVLLSLQLGLPLLLLGLALFLGSPVTGFLLATILMLSAPALVGSPNLVAMSGHDPGVSMLLLVVGTLLFPLTAFVTIYAIPDIEAKTATAATVRLATQIFSVVIIGIITRKIIDRIWPTIDKNAICDDATALLLGVVVIGLMADVGPLLRADPLTLAIWVAGVMLLNFGLQISTFQILSNFRNTDSVATAVFAGNRNTALYFLALPPEILDEIMLFVGCYQIPMYLTPLLMRKIYQRNGF